MSTNRIVLSSGHGLYVRGASGYLDEVNEARRVVDTVASLLSHAGVEATTFHDDVSRSQSENLERIVSFHNSQQRDLDVSVHFNAYQTTNSPMGTECLYVTQSSLAATVASKIAAAGDLINRGAKQRNDLYFLNETEMPAVLVEVCFVDSFADAEVYLANFDEICEALAEALSGLEIEQTPEPPDTFCEALAEAGLEIEPELPDVLPPPPVVVVSITAPEGVEVNVTINGEPR
jgi:N-acetylmuramoyl-L-alanine amidase